MALLTGYSSTHIQCAPTTAGHSVAPFRGVVVAAIDDRPDVRAGFENDLVRNLDRHGLRATSSYHTLTLAEIKGDRDTLRQKLQAAGAEGFLIVRTTDRADFVSGPSLASSDASGGGASEMAYDNLRIGTMETDVRLGARLSRVTDGLLMWSGLVHTVFNEGDDSLAVIERVAKAIVAGLAKDKLIP